MITTRSWILMAATVLMGIVAAIVWFSTRHARCVGIAPVQAALRSAAPRLVRVQDDDDGADPEVPMNPPDDSERELQEAQRRGGSPCAAYLDKVQNWRALTQGATGLGVVASVVSLYFDREAKKRKRRRRRRRKMPIA